MKEKIQAEEEIRITQAQYGSGPFGTEAAGQGSRAERPVGLWVQSLSPHGCHGVLAERVMRDEFAPTLTSNLSRFSNPMSEENAQAFARDTFEGLNIQGGFAQRRASEALQLYVGQLAVSGQLPEGVTNGGEEPG